MERLTKKRKPIRSSFTKIFKEMEAESDPNTLKVYYATLTRKVEQLRELDDQILVLLLDVDDEQRYNEEYNRIDEYYVKYERARQKVENITTSSTPPPSENLSIRNNKLKLPKIKLRKFSGEVSEWLGFWSQFSRIHDDPDVENEDKFQYLIQATEEGTKARDVVMSFSPTSENYDKAIEALKSRFGRDELLIKFYVRELLNLVVLNVSPKARLSPLQLYDNLELHLRSLESLGMTGDKYAALIFPLVESSLPEELLRTWLRSSVQVPTTTTDVKQNEHCEKLNRLLAFLKNEVEGEQRIKLAQGGFLSSQLPQKSSKQKTKGEEIMPVPTTSNLFSGDTKIPRKHCVFCKGSHEAKECFRAQKMTLAEKKTILMKGGCCYQCLRPGHTTRNCKAELRCNVCGKQHVVLMCPDLFIKNDPQKENKQEESKQSTSMSSQSLNEEVFLQTLMVKLHGPQDVHVVRALIDSGSQRSYILKKTAEQLGLKSCGSEVLIHALFRGLQSEKQSHQLYETRISGLDGKDVHVIPLLDQSTICGSLPQIRRGLWLRELKANKIFVSDCGQDRPEIELLLDADVCGRLITGRVMTLKAGPIAVETHLGWVLMGRLVPQATCETIDIMVTSLLSLNKTITDLWQLDTLGIQRKKNKG